MHGAAGPAALGGSHVSAADPPSGSGVRGNCLFLGARGLIPHSPGEHRPCLDLGPVAGGNRIAVPARQSSHGSPWPGYASCFWKELQARRGPKATRRVFPQARLPRPQPAATTPLGPQAGVGDELSFLGWG